ncbi:MAG TPA: hypothetical protein VGI76_10695 [Solirubrobacteraceae bacterium]
MDEAFSLAAEIRERLLTRSRGMPELLHEELFAQRRLVGEGFKDAPPTLVVNCAEGTSIFRGLNHSRNLIGPIDSALAKIAADPQKAIETYERKVKEARETAAGEHL